MMITNNKRMNLIVILAVVAVIVLGNVEATNMRYDASSFVTIRSLSEMNDTSGNATNVTIPTDTSDAGSLWMRLNAVSAMICAGLTALYLS